MKITRVLAFQLRALLAVVVVAGLAQGCATVSENMKRSFSPSRFTPSVVDYPAIGETRTAEVGESLIWKGKQTTIPAVDVKETVTYQASNMGKSFVITVLPGRYVEQGKDASGTYYKGEPGTLLADGAPVNTPDTGIYISDADPSKTEVYVLPANWRPLSYPKDGIPFSRASHQRQDALGFKRELVYTGVSKNVVFVLYREFSSDLARPAFSQELKYDLSEGRVVGYRGARFEVISATNQGIKYKTLKQLD